MMHMTSTLGSIKQAEFFLKEDHLPTDCLRLLPRGVEGGACRHGPLAHRRGLAQRHADLLGPSGVVRKAATHDEMAAGDLVGRRRAKEHHGARDVIRLLEATEQQTLPVLHLDLGRSPTERSERCTGH